MQVMADRFLYLPQIGICMAMVWAPRTWPASGADRRWALAGVSVLVSALIVCAWQQTRYWRDSEALWAQALACNSQNSIAHNNLGNVMASRGQIDEAITHYRKALEIRPNYLEAHYNLALELADQGRLDEAGEHFQKALALATAANNSAFANVIRRKSVVAGGRPCRQDALIAVPAKL